VRSTSPSFAAAAANAYARAYIQVSTKEFISAQLATESQIQGQITNVQSQITTVTNELNATSTTNGASTSPTVQTQPSSSVAATRLNAQLTGLYSQLSSLQTQLNQVQLVTAQGSSAGQLVTPAVTDNVPVSPKRVEDAMIAAALGLLLGLGFALLRDHVDDRIRGVADLEIAGTGLPALGLVPVVTDWRNRKAAFLVTAERPRSPAAEAYRALRTSVQFMAVDRPVKILQLTSPGAVEGKTTTSVNLAYAMGEAGQRVVLVDCDLRRPRVHEFFNLSNEVGLTSILLGRTPLEKALMGIRGNAGLKVVTAGPVPPNPSELLSGGSIARLFRSLAEVADLIILDSAPVLPVSDALALAARADAVLVVASAGVSTSRGLARTLELLSRVDARIVGTVLNRAPEIGSYAPYAYSRYGYGYEPRNTNGAVNEIEPVHLRRDSD
jgi:polysaccharide biosynthesis transport protein